MHFRLIQLCLLTSLACIAPLSATIVGGVEYSTAPDVRQWQVAQKFKTKDSEVTLYILEGRSRDDYRQWDEVFTVQVTCERLDLPVLLQQDSIYSFGTLEYKTLANDAQSILTEWWTSGQPSKMHGWIRCFHTSSGTTCLQYVTMKPERVEWARQVWSTILRQAQLTEDK